MNEYTGLRAILWDSINPLEGFLILRFVIFHVGYKKESRKHGIAILVCMIAYSISVPLNERLFPNIPVALFFDVIIVMIFGRLYLNGTILNHISLYMISVLMLAFADTFVLFVTVLGVHKDNAYDYIMNHFEIRMPCALIGKTLLIVLMELYFYIRKKKTDKWDDTAPELVICISTGVLLNAILVYNLMVVSKDMETVVRLMIYLLLFLLFQMAVRYYLSNIREKERRRKELEIILAEEAKRQSHYEEDSFIYRMMREKRHDTKHHLAYLEYLATEKNYNEMINYLKEVMSE